MSRPVRNLLEPLLSAYDSSAMFAAVCGAHDLGKADPVFQGQLLSSRREDFAGHLAALDLPLPDARWASSVPPGPVRAHLRHEAVTGKALRERDVPGWVCSALAGHHGRYLPDLDRKWPAIRSRDNTLSGWAATQDELLGDLLAALDLPVDALSTIEPAPRGVLVPLLTGLVSVADWLASDDRFLDHDHLGLLEDPAAYMAARTEQARTQVREELGLPVPRQGAFADLFAGMQPTRPAQAWATGLDHGPGLSVVTVPMGEGKTETALWMHASRSDLREGLLFGLPTTATADAMLERVLGFYADADGLVHLAHGKAVLNDLYRPSNARPVGICDTDHDIGHDTGRPGAAGAGGLRPGSWFRGRHRALSAPVTVATCDQVLAAALAHKFNPVRLAALAGKHLVLDEVHTYDPYQDRLLIRLLGWLGAYRTRVTLLTATLPTRRLGAYHQAYRDGWLGTAPAAEPMELAARYPSVTRTVGDDFEQHPVNAHRTYTHRIQVRPIGGGQHRLSDTAAAVHEQRAAHPEARIGVIVNTVDRAIDLADALESAPGATAPVLLLHSRMTFAQRRHAVQQLLDRAGKSGPAGPLTVVATQIAEASLDIDFDVLLTDLAPMTSLLQRAGRQWRHSDPHGDGTWTHPASRSGRRGDPVLHVLVATAPDGTLDRSARFPYTQAELAKTWRAPAALDRGNRTELRVPDDLQAAVDAADVSFADLETSPDAEEDLRDLTEHLAAASLANDAGSRIGLDATSLDRAARRNDDWDANPTLSALTQGQLWQEEVVTRLRDTDSMMVLLVDPTRAHPHAWHGETDDLVDLSDRDDVLEVLDHVIPTSGVTATELRKVAAAHRPSSWHEHAPALLRDIAALPLTALPARYALTDRGLERRQTITLETS